MIRKPFLLTLITLFATSLSVAGATVPDPAAQSTDEIQAALGTSFTYQGRLTDGGSPASGTYDFQFQLYDASSNQVGSTISRNDVAVANGLFSVPLDFGDMFTGDPRFLEVSVRPGSSTGDYATLTPRQALTPAPYAMALPGVFPLSGNVGIGTTSPAFQLSLGQSTANTKLALYETGADNSYGLGVTAGHFRLHLNGSGARFAFYDGDESDSNEIFTIKGNGDVGIGVTSPAYKLDVAGSAHASGFPTSSDARLKTNVTQLTNVLDRLEEVRGVSFEWNAAYESLGRSTGHSEIGVIAQEVEAVFPELVTTWGDEGYRAVDYGRLTGVLIEGIKELRAEKDAEIAALQLQNADLEARVAALEALVAKLAQTQSGGAQ